MLKEHNVANEIKELFDVLHAEFKAFQKWMYTPFACTPCGLICCFGICILSNRAKRMQAFIKDQIEAFNLQIAAPKDLELRMEESTGILHLVKLHSKNDPKTSPTSYISVFSSQ